MRYYLHIHYREEIVPDEEGIECAGLEQARLEAIRGIRSLLAEERRGGRVSLSGRIVVMGRDDRILLTVPFREAVRIAD